MQKAARETPIRQPDLAVPHGRQEVGLCSTRPGVTSDTRGETGVDTLRLLFSTRDYAPRTFTPREGWRGGSVPELGLTWLEGHPRADGLATPEDVITVGGELTELVDNTFGLIEPRGCSRLDVTTTRPFASELEARAFLAGMATLELPRKETIRRGDPVHSVAWAHHNGRALQARCYDKGRERGGESWRQVRLEDQRRYGSGGRPSLEAVADPEYQRDAFRRRFEPMRKAVDGVKAASFPVVAQALADEVKYGYRPWREAERLAGALVLFAGGVKPSRGQSTLYRRRAALREAGFVVVDDYLEPVDVDLGAELERALEEFGA